MGWRKMVEMRWPNCSENDSLRRARAAEVAVEAEAEEEVHRNMQAGKKLVAVGKLGSTISE